MKSFLFNKMVLWQAFAMFSILLLSDHAQAQCIAGTAFGSATSNNSGSVQTISTCTYAGERNTVSGLTVGANYRFTATGGAGNFITITDTSNVVIAFGNSPVNVTNIGVTSVRLHLHTSAACGTDSVCHTTTVQLLVTCQTPSDFTASIGTNSATINWTALGNAANYEFEYAAGTLTPGSGTVVSTNTNSVTLNGLTQNTLYQFRVRTNCTGSDGSSLWSGIFQFTTDAIVNGGNVFTSPNFPSNYANNTVKGYSIIPQTAAGHNLSHQKASITFTSFNVERGWDGVLIFNGPDATAPIFDSGSTFNRPFCPNGAYTGSTSETNSPDFRATGLTFTSTHPSGALYVLFLSDDSVVRAGWSAYVTLTTEGRDDSCGSTFGISNTEGFYAKRVLGADQYTFELTDMSDMSVQQIVRNTWSFGISDIAGVNYGKTYSVRTRARIGGNYAPYAAACTINTIAAPSAALTALYCDQSFTNPISLYANRVAGSQEFTFEVTNENDDVLEVVRASNFFHIRHNTNAAFYGTGGSFTVRVKVKVNDMYGDYGTPCNVFFGAMPTLLNGNASFTDTVVAYPNPFTDSFTVKLADFSTASIQVFDINGRMIENSNVDNTYEVEMGQNLSQGVYVVRVEQNGETQSFKMIKK